MSKKDQTEMIDRSFFSSRIGVDVSRVFPVIVMATMSGGKSTLINALLETDLLPSRNQACTAKTFSVLDDDSAEGYRVYITKKDGSITCEERDIQNTLEAANEDPGVRDVLIVGDIKSILNTDKSLLVIDTPGPNNSLDTSHRKKTDELLKKVKRGLILYVINATQMGISDDAKLLKLLRAKIESDPYISVLFVLNKIDQLDIETESVSDMVLQTKKYIESNGISNAEILPVSALSAKLFKKVLNRNALTRRELRDFNSCYELFRTNDLKMTSYAVTRELPDQFEKIAVGREEFTVAQLKAALENTGLPYLEKYIQKQHILSSENIAGIGIGIDNGRSGVSEGTADDGESNACLNGTESAARD